MYMSDFEDGFRHYTEAVQGGNLSERCGILQLMHLFSGQDLIQGNRSFILLLIISVYCPKPL